MRTLRMGLKGEDVMKWQHFLRGLDLYVGEADGDFGPRTREATTAFQRQNGLKDDGIAGNVTLGVALQQGFDAAPDDPAQVDTLDGPPKPDFPPLGPTARRELFGNYTFEAAPIAGNPENIKILDGWEAANIQLFDIPQLVGKQGANSAGRARFHRLVGPKVQALFDRWQNEGLLGRVLTWEGSFVPRFIRGSKTILSTHAHGSAFDINAKWNGLGAMPALRNKEGSVRELVSIANELGFYWGGHFESRRDGMHFELAKL